MTDGRERYYEISSSDAVPPPPSPDDYVPPATISAYLELPAVRKMALYGVIGGAIGIAAAVLLIFIVSRIFGNSSGAFVDAARFGEHPDLLGTVIAFFGFTEVTALTLVGALALVSLGIGFGIRRVATFHDNPDGFVAIAVAVLLCVIGFPFGLLNPILMALFAGGAYLVATFRQRTFRNIALILGFIPIILPIAIIWLVIAISRQDISVSDASATVGQWQTADQRYKEEIAARERAKEGGQG